MTEIATLDHAPTTALAPRGDRAWSEDDRDALRRAVATLERPSLAARLSNMAGRPLDIVGRALPATVTDMVAQATQGAMKTALRVALATLPAAKAEAVGSAVTEIALPRRRFFGTDLAHRAAAAFSGAVGGAFGLASLPVELPVTTTVMLRSIAEIARAEGEDLATPEGALACLQVFALGGRGGGDLTESGYFAVRTALAKTLSEATRYVGQRGIVEEGAPALVRFVAQIAARFGIVVSQKVAAQAVPIIGAVGGAALNATFTGHFQALARAHFTVRRLERAYGAEEVRTLYEAERAALAPAP